MTKQLLSWLLCLLLFTGSIAQAEDLFTLTLPDAGSSVVCPSSSVVLYVPLSSPCEVSLTIRESGTPVYQRSFGYRTESFYTDTLYLRLTGAQTAYEVTLLRGESAHSFTILRRGAGFQHVQACSAGLSLQMFTGRDTFETATMLDLSSPTAVADVNYGGYRVGLAIFTITNRALTVSFVPENGIQAESCTVQLAYLSEEAAGLGRNSFVGQRGTAGVPMMLHSNGAAVVYLQVTISGTTDSLPPMRLDEPADQRVLFNRFLNESIAVPNG